VELEMTGDKSVYLIDDDAAIRHALGVFLENAGFQVSTYASALDFLGECTTMTGGVLLLDQRMPGMSGMQLQERLDELGIFMPIIFITGHGDVQMSVAAMKAGAMDFLEKPFDNSELLKCIREAGKKAAVRRSELQQKNDVEKRYATLTSREMEVMQYIVQGKSNRVIAEYLGLSNRTIEVHRARVMAKMGADSLADLVRKSEYCKSNR
jgi:two-component system response regulator FixJ